MSRVRAGVDPSKLELIKQGKKKVNETGVKENKKTISNKDGQFVAIEKERKFEEAGVTKKKRNFVMYESKLGTEKDVDLLKIAGAKKKAAPRPPVEETIISKHKKKEYLDNFQYHETKVLKNKKPAVVIHNRVSSPITGTVEEYSMTKTVRSTSAGKNGPGKKTTTTTRTTKTEMNENKSSANLRSRPQPSVTATKSTESTTKVGRRGGAGGKTSTTTTTKTETKTTSKGGETKSSTRTTTTRQRK
jgi:hypothetical protein